MCVTSVILSIGLVWEPEGGHCKSTTNEVSAHLLDTGALGQGAKHLTV